MWIYLVVVVLLGFGIYAFISITGVQTRWLSRRSSKTAESMYDSYGDPDRQQRRFARQHDGTQADAESPEYRPHHVDQ